nr:lysine--tRNA ligase-like [Lytechinus pictus]
MIEIYEAYADMNRMMELTEQLISNLARCLLKKTTIDYGDRKIDLSAPFARITMNQAVKKYAKIDFEKVKSFEEAKQLARENGIKLSAFDVSIGHVLNLFFEEIVQPQLIQPTFVHRYPKIISPFAKSCADNSEFTDRFELFITGKEYANAFSELNDPFDQERRFEDQIKEREKGNQEANEIDYDYLNALGCGLPPTGGLGIGIDRLVMLLTNSLSIKDVILFPTLKPDSKQQKEPSAAFLFNRPDRDFAFAITTEAIFR